MELQKIKRVEYIYLIGVFLIYTAITLSVVSNHISNFDTLNEYLPVRYSFFGGVGINIALFLWYSFSFFMLGIDDKIPEVRLRFYIYGCLIVLINISISQISYLDSNIKADEMISIRDHIRRQTNNNKRKEDFNSKVAKLEDFINQDSSNIDHLDLLEIRKLGLKNPRPNRYNDRVLKDKSIVPVAADFLPIKEVLIANAYFQLGKVYQDKLNYVTERDKERKENIPDISLFYYKRAAEIDSTIYDYHIKLASRAKTIEKYDLAFKHFKIALELDSTQLWVQSEISECKTMKDN